ncbi:Rpp20 subunit of nuclear RNase MRP and P-domain-containing protein [Parachaetomium inaequale]|uniref:Rpp20 subunit of nuclear RNase MRP and P-domain-containing protein n=1 Tax=Parachaetomium inaequale TaxID=2588326 RepID=A0AAN6SSI7_9PEZI|nr:Rpp20 subunit of nuclear RNase MRP and P-domain-containing protein [Parachaetomium inaequale]
MAPTPPTSNSNQNTLPNKPETKLPPIPHGSRIQKRPLPGPSPAARPRTTAPMSIEQRMATADPDGYIPPPRATHTAVIKVSSGASFMSLVRRVRKALEKAPACQSTKGLPLTARVAALKVGGGNGGNNKGAGGNGSGSTTTGRGTSGLIADALDDVVLVATGRAIERAVDVAGFFTREKDLVVLMRTRTLRAVDDVVAVDEEADVEDEVRVRYVNCLEVGVRWAS